MIFRRESIMQLKNSREIRRRGVTGLVKFSKESTQLFGRLNWFDKGGIKLTRRQFKYLMKNNLPNVIFLKADLMPNLIFGVPTQKHPMATQNPKGPLWLNKGSNFVVF